MNTIEVPMLNFFTNLWYFLFTTLGFVGFWAAKVDKVRKTAIQKGIPFHFVNCLQDYLWPFIISGILTYSGNMILVEYSMFRTMELAVQYAIISGLAWGGGSGFKYAHERINYMWKKFVDKWTNR